MQLEPRQIDTKTLTTFIINNIVIVFDYKNLSTCKPISDFPMGDNHANIFIDTIYAKYRHFKNMDIYLKDI